MAKANAVASKIEDPIVLQYMEMLDWAYHKSLNDLNRLEEFQRNYDNVVNDMAWPTTSKMPIPTMFTAVEKALPSAMSQLFPKNHFVTLLPTERSVSMESVRKTEWALQHTVTHRMKLQQHALPTIKDCFKLSIGYGIVEPAIVTPPRAFVAQVEKNGKTMAKGRFMGTGTPKRTQRYRYIGPGQIIVTPDGTDFNGDDRVSVSFFLDVYSEEQFRAMYKESKIDSEHPELMGDPEKIIAEARSKGFDFSIPVVNLMANLAGIDLKITSTADKRFPTRIPVLKCYAENRHIWIANGTTRIFDQENRYQTLRCPLVRCSAWPEGHRWYPMSAVEAAQKMSLGINVWTNAMFDVLTYVLKPLMVYNKTAFGNKAPERGPNSSLGISTGSVNDAAKFLDPPVMPEAMFGVGDVLQKFFGSAIGQEAFAQQGSAGLLRGGAFAFESLMASSTGREMLAGAILQTGWLEPVIVQTLICMQLNAQSEEDLFVTREYSPITKEESINEFSITENDVVHAFDLSLDMGERHRNTMADQQGRMAEFNAFKGDPYIDQWELRNRTIWDETAARRLILPKEEVRRMQEEDRAAQLAAAQQGEQPAGTAGLPATPTTQEQALAGAARVTGA